MRRHKAPDKSIQGQTLRLPLLGFSGETPMSLRLTKGHENSRVALPAITKD
ncbi:MAG: hypothetical protein HZB80_02785 [Deltaproteobacteria bacterium]|nr:hypothetical protein [Deltaproteobacteria bacterium]